MCTAYDTIRTAFALYGRVYASPHSQTMMLHPHPHPHLQLHLQLPTYRHTYTARCFTNGPRVLSRFYSTISSVTTGHTPSSMASTGGSDSRRSESRSRDHDAPLQKRSVVSSFLYKFVDEDGQRKARVALFKRSGQVRTYQ